MPWGAWITCEETVNGPDVGDDFTRTPVGGTDPVPTPTPEPAARGAARLHLRGAHQRLRRRPADHRSGAVLARGGGLRPQARRPLPHRGRLRVPVRLLPLPPASGRSTSSAGWTPRGRLQMLAVKASAQRPPRGAPGRRDDLRGRVGRHRPARLRRRHSGRGPAPDHDQRRGHQLRREPGLGRTTRVLRSSPASRARSTTTGPSTSPRPRAAGRREADPTGVTDPTGFGQGFGQVWGYDIQAKRLRVVYQSPGQPTLDLPDNITVSPRGHVGAVRGQHRTELRARAGPAAATCSTSR